MFHGKYYVMEGSWGVGAAALDSRLAMSLPGPWASISLLIRKMRAGISGY